MCEPCREDRRAAKRALHAERREKGLCVQCATPAPGGKTYCDPCAGTRARRRNLKAKREADRRRYAERRAGGRCVECDAPSPGVARCKPCSRRHRESSGAYRGIPIWDPTWTVIEIATGRDLGTYDSEAEIALCLAFEKLSREQVEVLCDASPMSSYTAPPW